MHSNKLGTATKNIQNPRKQWQHWHSFQLLYSSCAVVHSTGSAITGAGVLLTTHSQGDRPR